MTSSARRFATTILNLTCPNGKRWTLRPGWIAEYFDHYLILRTDVRRFVIRAGRLEKNATVAYLASCRPYLCVELPAAIINTLVTYGAICQLGYQLDQLSKGMPYDRQSAYFEHIGVSSGSAIASLQEARVLILGIGGVGSIVLEHLVAAGLQHFVLVDDDRIATVNLDRQFICTTDSIGRKKVDAAADYVRSRCPEAELKVVDKRIKTSEDVVAVVQDEPHLHMAFVCIDEPCDTAFEVCASALWKINVPFIHGGVMIRSGFYGPIFDAARTAVGSKSFSLRHSETVNSFMAPLQVAFPPYNTIIGAHIVAEALHHLVGAHHLVDYQCRTFVDLSRGVNSKLAIEN